SKHCEFLPYLSASLRQAHICPPAVQLFWNVRLVGIVHLVAAIFIAAGRARRTRPGRHGHHHAAGRAEPVWNVSRISEFWLGSRPSRPTQGLPALYVGGSSSGSSFFGGPFPPRAPG